MNASDYIISELKVFLIRFSSTRVRYEYDTLSDTHFVEIVPNEVYNLNQEYIEWEGQMIVNFIGLFPDQNICFISDDAAVGLENVQFESLGTDFNVLYSSDNHKTLIDDNSIVLSAVIRDYVVHNISVNPDKYNGFEISQNNLQKIR